MTQLKAAATLVSCGLAGLATFPLMTHAVTPGTWSVRRGTVRQVAPQANAPIHWTTPRQVNVAVDLVDVRASAFAKVKKQAGGADLLTALRAAGATVTKAPRITTTEDTPAQISTTGRIPYTPRGNGPTQHNYVTVGITLQANPHINADGSIRVTFKVTQTEVSPQGLPNTTSSSISSIRTVKSGETVVAGGISTVPTGRPFGKPTTPNPMERVILLTATLVPDEHGPPPAPTPAT